MKAYLTSERPTPGSGAAWLGSRSTRQQWLAAPGQVCGELGWSWNRSHPWQFSGLQPWTASSLIFYNVGENSLGWAEDGLSPPRPQVQPRPRKEGSRPGGPCAAQAFADRRGKEIKKSVPPGVKGSGKTSTSLIREGFAQFFFFNLESFRQSFKSPRVGGPWSPLPGAWPSGLRAVTPTGPAPADLIIPCGASAARTSSSTASAAFCPGKAVTLRRVRAEPGWKRPRRGRGSERMQTGRRKGGQRWQEGTRRPGRGPWCPWGWDGGLAGGAGPIGWGRARAAGGVFQDDSQVGGEVTADPSWPLPGPSSLPPAPRTFGRGGGGGGVSDWSAPGRQSLFRPYSCPLAWQCVPEQVPAGAGPSGCPMILKGVMLKRKNYRAKWKDYV